MKNTTNGFTNEDIEKNKTMAGIGYLVPILPFFLMKDSKFIRFHANQMLLIFIPMAILATIHTIIAVPLMMNLQFTIFGIISFILSIIYLAFSAAAIVNMIAAFQGSAKRVPVIGKMTIIPNSNDVDVEDMFQHAALDKLSDGLQNLSIPTVGTTCPSCKEKVPVGKKFCNKCGASMPTPPPSTSSSSSKKKSSLDYHCSNCKKEYASDTKFCTDCGQEVVRIPEYSNPKCSKCQLEVNEGVKFCPECGGAVIIEEIIIPTCKNCKEELSDDIKFCPKCGTAKEEDS